MLIYSVTWKAHEDLAKGKGRVKHGEFMFHFTVLCRSITDASSCLDYLHDCKSALSSYFSSLTQRDVYDNELFA